MSYAIALYSIPKGKIPSFPCTISPARLETLLLKTTTLDHALETARNIGHVFDIDQKSFSLTRTPKPNAQPNTQKHLEIYVDPSCIVVTFRGADHSLFLQFFTALPTPSTDYIANDNQDLTFHDPQSLG